MEENLSPFLASSRTDLERKNGRNKRLDYPKNRTEFKWIYGKKRKNFLKRRENEGDFNKIRGAVEEEEKLKF